MSGFSRTRSSSFLGWALVIVARHRVRAVRRAPMRTIVCLASYFKGGDFLRECRARGARVVLIVRDAVRAEDWPFDCHRRPADRAQPGDVGHLRRSGERPRPPHARRRRRGARGVRRPARGCRPRAPASRRDGDEHGTALSRQAGHARHGAGGGHHRSRLRPRAERGRPAPVHARGVSAVGPQAAIRRIGRRHPEDRWRRAPLAGDRGAGPAAGAERTVLGTTCWSATSPERSSTSMRWSSRAACCTPVHTAIGARPWRSRTMAACS